MIHGPASGAVRHLQAPQRGGPAAPGGGLAQRAPHRRRFPGSPGPLEPQTSAGVPSPFFCWRGGSGPVKNILPRRVFPFKIIRRRVFVPLKSTERIKSEPLGVEPTKGMARPPSGWSKSSELSGSILGQTVGQTGRVFVLFSGEPKGSSHSLLAGEPYGISFSGFWE